MEKLKIGDILYHYASINGVFEYKVIEIRESEDNVQYLIECQQCEHGDKCKLLVVRHESHQYEYKKNVYKFVCMIGDDSETNEHYIWHNKLDYFTHKNLALIDRARFHLKNKDDKLQEAKIKFKTLHEEYMELKKYIEDLIFEVENL